MSDQQTIAEHGVAITLAAFGLAGAAATVSVSCAVLAAVGFQSFRDSRKACETAVTTVLNKMKASESPAVLAEVRQTLTKSGRQVTLGPGDMPEPRDRETLDAAFVTQIMTVVPPETGPDATALIRVLFQHAVAACRYTPEIHRVIEQDVLWSIFTDVRAMRRSLDSLATANRDQLEALAARFQIERAWTLTDTQLRAELDDRAAEYEALRRQVAALDDRTAGLANLKAGAQDAVDRLDFEEVETLFAHIHATERAIATETAMTRADNLLLLDRQDAARDVLLDAADACRRTDRDEWLRLMQVAAKRLHDHGLKRSGPAMASAAAILSDLAQARDRVREAQAWAADQNNLGLALLTLGERGADTALRDAVTAYRAALQVRTRDALPVAWAATQNNLGTALATLGERGDDAALRDAVTAYRAALQVHTRDALPVQWATTQNNLGNALRTLGERGDDTALRDAVTAFRAALQVHTRDALPVQWAMTQNNLGNALRTLGERGDETALRDAVTAFRAALQVRTRDALPVQWAMTQNNLGNALLTLGQRGDDTALRDAVTAYRAALQVRTRDALPVDWAMTRENMALCFEAMITAFPEESTEHLAAARAAVADALTVYDPETMPYYHEGASRLRDHLAVL
ncbi:tetratricopeptide repeat protein [Jannaschia sp. M317]|uniref:tetratricopeptide repeat protein n=1 Tax=Jannaschia sp. M317 TaxID=2867011 RepID=UPI0021A5ED42|nr:tetratricopeptide repeat protein [Jannaschia sp. M317]UWQ16284.1 tetratricopeptide repeat protein [Jannaschia sp. M317]